MEVALIDIDRNPGGWVLGQLFELLNEDFG